ncbi:MAG: hypothetical protein CL847_06415 [Crocinitomicaceae bacterium]|nr:hypothetical protein [Crocinitomicaceae bacterium]|tara:strand:+ start:382 stop:573 length:192 start_codon:yes stop_codon:yes gene_type:complete
MNKIEKAKTQLDELGLNPEIRNQSLFINVTSAEFPFDYIEIEVHDNSIDYYATQYDDLLLGLN